MFKAGDEVVLTQSSMQLEDLIGKFLVSGGPQKPGSEADPPTQDAGGQAPDQP
jgi:phospholipid/cholesterol/gamma-HCH transport system substrate-binding protein